VAEIQYSHKGDCRNASAGIVPGCAVQGAQSSSAKMLAWSQNHLEKYTKSSLMQAPTAAMGNLNLLLFGAWL
jgi:hypothetical protein